MAEIENDREDPRDVPQKERFFRYFQHEVTALQEQIGRLGHFARTGGERADAIDHCLAGIARLSHEVKDASVYLPAYDQRTYAEAIKALQEKLTETKATLAPRQKFTFKSTRKSPSAISLNDAAVLATQRPRYIPGYRTPGSPTSDESSFSTTPAYVRTPPSTDNTAVPTLDPALEASWPDEDDDDEPVSPDESQRVRRPTFSKVSEVQLNDHSKVHIIVPTSASHATMPASITRIRQSVIDIAASTENGRPFASLMIKSVRRSLLVCGGVNGPAHITDVKDSVIVVNCRQLRMHQCVNVDIYLACASRPIIEDCNGIAVGGFPGIYITPHLSLPSPNLSTQVQDFNNPAAAAAAAPASSASMKSPNWSIMSKPAPKVRSTERSKPIVGEGKEGKQEKAEVPEEIWRRIISRDGFGFGFGFGGSSGGGSSNGNSVKEILRGVGIGLG